MKVTVAIPTYNSLNDLKKALESVLIQEYDDYEVVITDDSKNNEIEDYLKELNNPKVKYFHNVPSLGPAKNWNSMLEKAEGEYIKILFQDDWFLTKDALRKMVDLMDNNPQADFGYCKQIGFKRGTNKIVHRRAQKYVKRLQKDPMELFLSNRISAPSVVILRKSKNYRFDEKTQWTVDVDLYMRALLDNSKIAFLNEELVALGCSATQLTQSCINNDNLMINENLYLYNKYEKYILNSKYKNKIQKKIINLLQKYNIEDLCQLKKCINNDIKIQDFIVEYYTMPKLSLWAKVKNSLALRSRGGANLCVLLDNFNNYIYLNKDTLLTKCVFC